MTLRMVLGCTAIYAATALAAMAAGNDARTVTYEDRLAACTNEAKSVKGEQQARFIGECLRQHGSQQDKMRFCSGEAKRRELHGDERRAFMSGCLKA